MPPELTRPGPTKRRLPWRKTGSSAPSPPEEALTRHEAGVDGEPNRLSDSLETPGAAAIDVAAGTVVAGKYRLERLLKAGGMGAVWIATHLTLDTPVAIKFMAIPLDDDGTHSKKGHSSDAGGISRARFEREAKTAAQIRSANVVQILDYGVDRATAYIVMELLDGRGSARAAPSQRARAPRRDREDCVPVPQLLQRAHDAGMVHRDLKPGNIFLAKDGDTRCPRSSTSASPRPSRRPGPTATSPRTPPSSGRRTMRAPSSSRTRRRSITGPSVVDGGRPLPDAHGEQAVQGRAARGGDRRGLHGSHPHRHERRAGSAPPGRRVLRASAGAQPGPTVSVGARDGAGPDRPRRGRRRGQVAHVGGSRGDERRADRRLESLAQRQRRWHTLRARHGAHAVEDGEPG